VNADKLIDNAQVEMASTSYDSEDLLQKLLADYAQILAGEQINSQVPRRWLLIRQRGRDGQDTSTVNSMSGGYL